MHPSIMGGVCIGAASLFIVVFLLFLPFVLGRQNFHRRVVVPISSIRSFLRRLCLEPRLTLFRLLVLMFQFVSWAHDAVKVWIGRFHAHKLRPRLKSHRPSLLPLHRINSLAYLRWGRHGPGKAPSFTDLPPEMRGLVYREFVQLIPCGRWQVTKSLKADPKFLAAMAFIRTCKLVREELGPLIFRALKFETDTKYPFYRNLPMFLTQEIRDLSLNFRPSMEIEFIYYTLLRQLAHLQALQELKVTVRPNLLVDLDREFEYILRSFKRAHPCLQSVIVTTRVNSATSTDNVLLSRAMGRLVNSLLPDFGPEERARTSLWTHDASRGRFRPAKAWYCRISLRNAPQ